MIVWLASYPRSGNTFARLTLFHLFGHRSGSVYPGTAMSRSTAGDRALRSMVDRRPFALLDALEGPAFVKTHEVWQASDERPAVVVVRDGRDALVSYAHFLRDLPGDASPFEDVLVELMDGRGGSIGTWSESVSAWRKRSAPTALVRYEELQADPATAVKRATEEIGLDLGEARGEISAFPDLQQAVPGLFRRGRSGSWREEMPPRVEELFWERHGDTMESLGYERQ